jgi:outer membrane lipoprotein SlyB
MRIRHRFTVLTLAAAAALPLAAVPSTALAQAAAAGAQQTAIYDFRAEPVQRLRPGEVIRFNLSGTPGARVNVTVPGAPGTVALAERQPGQYSGEYTIRRDDRLAPESAPVARLERNNQWAEMRLGGSLLAGQQPRQGNQGVQNQPVANGPTRIDEFVVNSADRLRPGDEMSFTLRGTPRGQASVAVQGLPQRVALRESSPGVYQGSYVLRRNDNWRGDISAQATLVGERGVEATRRFDRALAGNTAIGQNDGVDRRAQSNAACLLCGRVQSVEQVEVPSDSKNILGSVAGGVIGGVLGHQVGGGTGKDLATVIGAVGGAYAGNRIQNNAGKTRVYRVAVRMDGGEVQSFDYAQDPQVQVGTLVRVQDGVLHRR